MLIETKLIHALNDYEYLKNVCNNIKREECQPINYYQDCSEVVESALTSLEIYKQALQVKIRECL